MLLPKTTTSAPANLAPDCLISSMTPKGVQGIKDVKSPTAVRPSFIVFNLWLSQVSTIKQKKRFPYPSTSLSGDTVSVIK